MKFSAVITANGEAENITKLFMAEEKNFKNKRSKYSVRKEKNAVIFEVSAEDATALRSTLDSIAKALKIYEDMKEIK